MIIAPPHIRAQVGGPYSAFMDHDIGGLTDAEFEATATLMQKLIQPLCAVPKYRDSALVRHNYENAMTRLTAYTPDLGYLPGFRIYHDAIAALSKEADDSRAALANQAGPITRSLRRRRAEFHEALRALLRFVSSDLLGDCVREQEQRSILHYAEQGYLRFTKRVESVTTVVDLVRTIRKFPTFRVLATRDNRWAFLGALLRRPILRAHFPEFYEPFERTRREGRYTAQFPPLVPPPNPVREALSPEQYELLLQEIVPRSAHWGLEFLARAVAFASGTHPRLGAASPLRGLGLSPGVLLRIVEIGYY